MMSDRITTSFGAQSTAAGVIAGIDLSGQRAIVTGGSSGIGVETARALAGAGACVTLAVRDTSAGHWTAADITASTGNHEVHVGPLDLADRASVAAFTAAWSGPLNLLINNAGVMALPSLQLTPEGWETQFATNHLVVISPWRWACTTRWPPRGKRGSSRSAPAVISGRR